MAELKSYTIVPDSLYVERNADKQLHGIVEAMQRPGYVLVSRQMGKTNLLLRAKRIWENSSDLYVYIDMSNIDETEKECFQSLIDTAIDTHEDELGSVRERITELRRKNIAKSPVQAHNEELRALLSVVKGKLVFILDEIDSLTRTDFSDNVFSQIRSVYFSRVNYPQLEKLTYVLSGVVEPTEIIKNPKISPFNIGEKILLDDFDIKEYHEFINKADLQRFGGAVIEQIYYWAGGNPRITWDICYELQHKKEITTNTVDSLVKEMYLTSFDKAPIDTIRNLVKEDRDLRDAIIQMAYGKGSTLSDKLKSKLYLAGIVNYNENDVRIKNKIISESLSLGWLQKIAEEEKGLLGYAIELHSKGLYDASIDKFNAYLKNNEFPSSSAPIYNFLMGSCYYYLSQYEPALKYLLLGCKDPKNYPHEYREGSFLAGVCCVNTNHPEEALAHFEDVMNGDERDTVFYSSKLNALTVRQNLYAGDNERIAEVESGFKELLLLQDSEELGNTKVYAAYHLGIMLSSERQEEALDAFNVALSYAGNLAKPRILLGKYMVVPEEERPALVDELIETVKDIKTVPRRLDPDKGMDIDESILLQILHLIYFNSADRWGDIKGQTSLLPNSYGDSLFQLLLLSVNYTDFYGEGCQRLVNELHENINSEDYNISAEFKLHVLKFYAYLNSTEENEKEYLDELQKSEATVDGFGLLILRQYVMTQFNKKDYRAIVRNTEWVIERYPRKMTHQDLAIRALFEYCLMNSYYAEGDIQSTIEIGRLILSYIDDVIKANNNSITYLTEIRNSAQKTLFLGENREPLRSTKTFRRNDKVKVRYVNSGATAVRKYKYVEEDLKLGNCVLVD